MLTRLRSAGSINHKCAHQKQQSTPGIEPSLESLPDVVDLAKSAGLMQLPEGPSTQYWVLEPSGIAARSCSTNSRGCLACSARRPRTSLRVQVQYNKDSGFLYRELLLRFGPISGLGPLGYAMQSVLATQTNLKYA